MTFLRLLVICLTLLLAGCAIQNANQSANRNTHLAVDTSRTLDLTDPPQDIWDRIRRGFAIPNLNDPLVDQWTNYYASHPEAVWRMSERAKRYLYFVVDELEQRHMPTELALLPFVESAYDPQALSRSQASGLWQFLPSTGEHFNLKQDYWQDQRRDPIASTRAALDYLAYLYDFQGDWYLALASYNWGEGSVKRAIDRNTDAGEPTDYQSLKLPSETRNYVPKLQAIKNIIANPARFGMKLPEISNTPYFTTVRKMRPMEVETVAKLAQMPVEEFKALNAGLNHSLIVPTVTPTIVLPANRVDIFMTNFEANKQELAWKPYQSEAKEPLAEIARKHGITLTKLRNINGLSKNQVIAENQLLWVPASQGETGLMLASANLDTDDTNEANDAGAPPAAARKVRKVVVPASSPSAKVVVRRRAPNIRTHTVKAGDTLYALAKRYNTSVAELRRLNNLRGNQLSLGSRLRIPGTDVRG